MLDVSLNLGAVMAMLFGIVVSGLQIDVDGLNSPTARPIPNGTIDLGTVRGSFKTQRLFCSADLSSAELTLARGRPIRDVWLSSSSFWLKFPASLSAGRIGGYQVLKKWLWYRDGSIIDRALTAEEVGHIKNTARRLAVILLMGPDLDASYRACAASHRPLQGG